MKEQKENMPVALDLPVATFSPRMVEDFHETQNVLHTFDVFADSSVLDLRWIAGARDVHQPRDIGSQPGSDLLPRHSREGAC